MGLNWFLNKNTKIVFNYERTHFTAIPGGRNRQTEKSFLERFQIAFWKIAAKEGSKPNKPKEPSKPREPNVPIRPVG